MIFITSILLISYTNSNPASHSNSSQNSHSSSTGCLRSLIQTYSMTGLDIPIIDKIEMCPSITRTCCLKQDQQIMFTNFIHGGEYQSVVDHYGKVIGIYSDLIEKLSDVQDFARTVKNNVVKKIANCKLLADRILNYELGQVREQIRINLEKMQEFFQTAYSGFYCTICNFDNQKYFDPNSQTIFFSEKFCRDIVENTLHTLLLFHVDIVKHANLVTKFVSSCDFTGTYNLDAIPPLNYTFVVLSDVMQDLQACRDNRNKREWFSYCKDICSHFQMSSFSSYFQPNLDLVSSYTSYLSQQLSVLNQAQSSRPLFGALSTPNGNNKRILEDGHNAELVFKPGLSAKINLSTWTSEFLPVGISLLDEGKNSLINEATYSSVKVFLQILANSNQNQAKNVNQAGGPSTNTSSRRLASISITNAFSFMVILILTLFK